MHLLYVSKALVMAPKPCWLEGAALIGLFSIFLKLFKNENLSAADLLILK